MTFKNNQEFVLLSERKSRVSTRPKTQDEWNLFIERYMTHTLKEMSEMYKCSVPTIRNWMKMIREETE